MGRVSLEEAEDAVARAAGIAIGELKNLTVLDVARKIYDAALQALKVVQPAHVADATVGEYCRSLSEAVNDIDAERMLRDLSSQTGLSSTELERMPLSNLENYRQSEKDS
jgi:hypothetical protein